MPQSCLLKFKPMKISLPVFLLVAISLDVGGQVNFNIIDSIGNSSYVQSLAFQNNYVRTLINTPIYLEIQDISMEGAIIRKKKILDFNLRGGTKVLLISDNKKTTYIAGYQNDRPALAILDEYMENISYITFEVDTGLLGGANSVVENGDEIIIGGNMHIGYKYNHEYWIPFIAWYNKITGVKTIRLLWDENTTGHLFNIYVQKDKNNQLIVQYLRQYHNPNFSIWAKGYNGFIKYNHQKKEIWRWEDTELSGLGLIPNSVIDKNNKIYFAKVHRPIGEGYPDNFNSVSIVNDEGKLENKIQIKTPIDLPLIDSSNPCRLYIEGDVIYAFSTVSVVDSIAALHNAAFLSAFDISGNQKWYRTFRNFLGDGLINKYFNKPATFHGFAGTLGIKDGNIFLGSGLVQTTYEPFVYYYYLLKLDSIGCFDDNTCNDFVITKTNSDLRFYDQPTMQHKIFYYSCISPVGSQMSTELTFKGDSSLFAIGKGNFFYRSIHYRDEKNQTFKDRRAVRWDERGQVYYAQVDSVTHLKEWRYEKLLYDFALKENDKFVLPENLGLAFVKQVDSIQFSNGHFKKRLILKFENAELDKKFGKMIWVEGIGAINFGFLYQDDLKSGTIQTLTCYHDRGILKYKHPLSQECLLSTLKFERIVSQTKIYPNPTSDLLNIDFGDANIYPIYYTIFNILGEEVYQGNVVSEPTIKIDVSGWKSGPYIIVFEYENGYRIGNKWVKFSF